MSVDSSAIDAALIVKLLSDATLHTLMPDGVFWAISNPGAKRFVIVDLLDHTDEAVFGGRAIEDGLYLVKAVGLSTSGANMEAAAARIDALLEDQALTVAGYTHMAMFRDGRVRDVERDEVDPSLWWQHRGGHYRVQMSVG